MMIGSPEILLLTVLFWAVILFVLYLVIKAAVRNGILEADDVRAGRRRGRTLADQRARIAEAEALARAVAESRRTVADPEE